MPLPKIDLPIYEIKLVSIPEPIKYRPFLVKEEKLLLMALQSEDEATIYNTIKQVVNNCIVNDVDIDKLPIFDLEYLFLQLRAKSVGEIVEPYFMCKNIITTEKTNEEGETTQTQETCGNLVGVKINLSEILPPVNDLPLRIPLTNTIGVQMKYPTVKHMDVIKRAVQSEEAQSSFKMIFDCLDFVYDAEGVYYANESSLEEFTTFIESLTQEQFEKVVNFFQNLPVISYETERACEKCGFVHRFRMEGLNDFFM